MIHNTHLCTYQLDIIIRKNTEKYFLKNYSRYVKKRYYHVWHMFIGMQDVRLVSIIYYIFFDQFELIFFFKQWRYSFNEILLT